MLTKADEGGRGGPGTPDLADVICEQPLNHNMADDGLYDDINVKMVSPGNFVWRAET